MRVDDGEAVRGDVTDIRGVGLSARLPEHDIERAVLAAEEERGALLLSTIEPGQCVEPRIVADCFCTAKLSAVDGKRGDQKQECGHSSKFVSPIGKKMWPIWENLGMECRRAAFAHREAL